MKYEILSSRTPHNADGFEDIKVYRPAQPDDERGFFEEMFNVEELGFTQPVRQISRSVSKTHVFRGLHWQGVPEMGKIMTVRKGAATFFAVDTRINADRRAHILYVSEWHNLYVYAPWYYARGFLTHYDETEVLYFQDETVSRFAQSVHYSASSDLAQYLSFFEPMMTISEKDQYAPKRFS